jgi:hypothetical protein
VDQAAALYVAEEGRICKRDGAGNWTTLAKEGKELGQVMAPSLLVVGQDGSLYVVDRRPELRVLQRDPEGRWTLLGGNVGGIRYQIQNGVNGFPVSSVEEAGQRIAQLLNDPKLREEMGRRARETVRKKFLMTRYLEQYLDLFGSFEACFRYQGTGTGAGTA